MTMSIQQPKKRSPFFFVMSLIGLTAVLIGFGKTFFLPVSQGSFVAPLIIHLHGAFAFGWIILFFIQAFLISRSLYSLHARLGIVGLILAAGIASTLFPTGKFVVDRDLAAGLGDSAYSTILGTIVSGLLFFSLVVAGIWNRNRPDVHKRFMLLATIVVLWPAWFRFRHYFPSVPQPEIWFALVLADSLILALWIHDWIRLKKIHPVSLYAGLFIILEQSFEVWAFDRPLWRVMAKEIYSWMPA
ncbi:MAG: hypothetical protein JNK20_02975 [Flavipsychrobacter sp.]|nr:hypothetical protein [Flavipsychrobacter sp.]